MSKRIWSGVAVMMMALGGAATEVTAQGIVADADAEVRFERAAVLADQALVIAKQVGDFDKASSLMQEAAALRGMDAGAVEALVQAAHFAYYGGRPLNAVSAFRRAGETARAIGDHETADRAFMSAAWVASREGEASTANAMRARVSSSRTSVAIASPLDRP